MSSAFTLFNKQVEAYCNKTHFYSGVKPYWIVSNRDPVLNSIRKSSLHKSAKCVSSFDFATLYTTIPHNKLLDVLFNILDFAFKGGTRNRVAISKQGTAYWTGNNSKTTTYFTKESIQNAVSFLISNCYFELGNRIFRQDIGIPMGSDPAPLFANLFLYYYESTWLKRTCKTNNTLARKFGNVFRYIDDLISLNDGHSFEEHYLDIYPPELQLKKENIVPSETTFLDLHISIKDRTFTTKLYDKRDSFQFNITRLPYKDSNIPSKMFYSSIAAECLRISRSTSILEDTITCISSLLIRMLKQGAEKTLMKNAITKIFNRHQVSQRFNTTTRAIIGRLFD